MKATTQIAWQWALNAFGIDHLTDLPTRSLRVAEEAIELAQAHRIPKAQMLQLVENVYARPHGEVAQEIGGVMMTLTLLCAAWAGREPQDYFDMELMRVLAIDPKTFGKRNETKMKATPDYSDMWKGPV